VLVDDPTNARPIVLGLLKGRVSFKPTTTKHQWIARGEGHLIGLFDKVIFPSVWRPQHDGVAAVNLWRDVQGRVAVA
jgi:hypothetical protein